jgi:tRNA (guanosine-2'-O-)-methyltransferase
MRAAELVRRHGVDTVVTALRPLISDERAARIEQVLDDRLGSVTVVLEDLYDPHNGAAAIRSVEAFGLTAVHAVEGAGPFRFGGGITIGAESWIDLHRHAGVRACAEALRSPEVAGRSSPGGFRLLATLPDGGDDLESVAVDRPLAIWFGNERDGLSAEAVAACDGALRIPMYGFTRSFNLSVSVALTLQRLAARRRDYLGTTGDLDDQERALLRAQWYALSVRAADLIVDRFVSE